jgi:hypothetical protein
MIDEMGRYTKLRFAKAEFVVDFPDTGTVSTILTDREILELIGSEDEYTFEWWIRGAEQKLDVHNHMKELTKDSGAIGSRWKLSNPTHDVLHFSGSYSVG